jgi:methyl-accepting chemotaxis protein
MQVSIAKRLLVVFGLMFAVMTVMGGSSLRTMATLNGEVERVASVTANGVSQSGRVRYLVAALEATLNRAVIATAKGDSKGVDAAIANAGTTMADLTAASQALKQSAADDKTREGCGRLETTVGEWKTSIQRVESFARAGQALEAAEAADQVSKAADQTGQIAAEIDRAQQESLESARASAAGSYRWSWWLMILVMLVAVAVSGAGGWTVRDIRTTLGDVAARLKDSSAHVMSASAQVASSSQSLSKGSSEQAASLEETSASMEEMASMTRRNAENSAQAAASMTDAERLVRDANGNLEELVRAMSGIQDSSAKIAKIIKTIDEIAFQTNILALNAAVEAARAGEAGMGFAVVAGEVRNLAHRSAQAAKDTAALIEDSSVRARDGGTKVGRVEQSIAAITESVLKVKALVDEISVASRQQAQGIDQVTQAISQMERVTQTTAATAEETAATSEELNAQVAQSVDVASRLERLVGNAAPSEAPPAAGPPRRKADVVPMTRAARAQAPAPAPSSAEAQIPFGDTGTYGSF